MKHKSPAVRLLLLVLIGAVLIIGSGYVDQLRSYQGAQAAIFAIAISSIVLLTGYSGQISLGHGALMAVGGYAAVLCQTHLHIPYPFAFLIGAIAGGAAGFLLGIAAARLRGPYLAGTTLALAVGLPSLANQFHILGGEQGLLFDVGNPPASLGSDFTQYRWFFVVAVIAAILVFWLLRNLLSTRYGRRWRALRANPTAAALSGIKVGKAKVLAFTLSSCVAGLAGSLFAMLLGLVAPLAFTLTLSFTLVTGAVLAGVSNLGGSIVGAVVLVAIPELSNTAAAHFGGSDKVTANLPGVITSVLLIATVLFVPNGPKLPRMKFLARTRQ